MKNIKNIKINYLIKFCIYIIIIINIINNNLNALVKENLYDINIKILSKELNPEQKKLLTEQAFAEVLQKITGKNTTLDLKTVDQYLNQYSYNDANNAINDVGNNQTILNISFDQKAINKALTTNNYKFLGEYRPLTMVWSKSSEIINNQELLQQIVKVAKSNGLSIIYPMYDMADLEFQDQNLIKHATKRYSADEVILVEIDLTSNAKNTSWKALNSNWQINIDLNNIDYVAQANNIVNNLMEHFINLYAVSNSVDQEIVTLKITNVINLEDYVKIEKYLQNLSFIKKLHAVKFEPGEIEFEIIASGGKEAIKSAMFNNSFLREIRTNKLDPANKDHNTLSYSL